jgi:hypothetical protein
MRWPAGVRHRHCNEPPIDQTGGEDVSVLDHDRIARHRLQALPFDGARRMSITGAAGVGRLRASGRAGDRLPALLTGHTPSNPAPTTWHRKRCTDYTGI